MVASVPLLVQGVMTLAPWCARQIGDGCVAASRGPASILP